MGIGGGLLLKPSEMSEKAVGILEGKKARDINVIDITEVSILADFFIICSGTSSTHIRTLADEVEEEMGKAGIKCLHKEGYDSARWILLDFSDVVVHVFHEEDRNFYKLERLWSDGKFSLPNRILI